PSRMALEQYAQEKERIVTGGKTPEAGPTLKEILADKEKGERFSQMMEAEGKEDLAAKMLDNSLDVDDLAELDGMRKMFIERGKDAEAIVGNLKPELLMQLGKRSPELQKMINVVGAENFSNVIQKQLLEVAYAEPGVFRDVANALQALNGHKEGRYKKS